MSAQRLPRSLRDVLEGAARGETAKETARRRVVSEATVRAQRRAILERTGTRRMAEAVAVAARERLFEDPAA
jgi:DNA-binding NarL/FixJ family response regulator